MKQFIRPYCPPPMNPEPLLGILAHNISNGLMIIFSIYFNILYPRYFQRDFRGKPIGNLISIKACDYTNGNPLIQSQN